VFILYVHIYVYILQAVFILYKYMCAYYASHLTVYFSLQVKNELKGGIAFPSFILGPSEVTNINFVSEVPNCLLLILLYIG
jgi:hypothetical protein